MISPGRLWWLLRRNLKRGWSASYHDYRTLPRIAEWQWPFWGEAPHPVPVHLLTGANDWRLAAWMLASWFHFTEHGWNVVVHDDGTLPIDAGESLRELFHRVRVIPREQSDVEMTRVLTPFPFCLDYRRTHPLALKIFDMAHYEEHPRYIVLDSDVLFFRRPEEILAWADDPNRHECWFNQDVQEASNVSVGEAREELDVALWPRVNSGICLIDRAAIDLDFCDRALANTSVCRGHVWRIEQTLFALCGSRHGKGGLLPKSYEVSLGRHASRGVVARHYVGAVRDRFYGEGLKRLHEELFGVEE
jgi:hypothetical protein